MGQGTSRDPSPSVTAADDNLILRAEQFDVFLDATQDGFLVVNEAGEILDANASYARMSGFSIDQLRTMTLGHVEAEQDRATIAENIRRIRESGSAIFETRHRTKDGQILDLEVNSTYWSRRGIFLSFLRDITEARQRESRLRDSEHRFRTLLETAPVAVGLVRDGRFVFANQEAARLLGYPSAEALVGVEALAAVYPDDRPRIAERLASATAVRNDDPIELRICRPDRRPRWGLSRSVPIDFHDGRGVLIVAQDITEQKTAAVEYETLSRRLEATIQGSGVGLWDWDLATDKVWYSREWKQQIGFADHEIGDDFSEWQQRVHPDDEHLVLERLQLAMASKEDRFVTEFRFRHRDGRWLRLMSHGSIRRDENGQPVHIVGTHLDVTEQRRIELELRRSENDKSLLLEATDEVFCYLDPDLTVQWANEAAAAALGHPVQQLLGKRCHELWHGSDQPCPGCPVVIARETGEDQEAEICATDGRYWHTRARPIHDASGQLTGLIQFSHEITEQKRAALERERQLRGIEQVSDAVVITDADGTIEYVNPAFERVTGFSRKEAIGQNPRILKSGRQDDAFYAEMWRTITAGETWQGRMVNRRRDGSLFTEECTITPVRDGEERIVNFVAVKRDITERLQHERETRELELQVQQIQKLESIGRLAGGVAHDLNNLLAPVIGYAELLQNELSPSDRRHDSAAAIVQAGLKARDLVRQLLTFSRRQVLDFETIDLNDLLTSFRRLLRRTIREDIEVAMPLAASLPPIHGDLGQLEQVVMNLAVNAQDAMPDGGRLTIETSTVVLDNVYTETHQGAAPGRFVLMSVSDDGIGMSADVRERVFEPFFTTKGQDHGTGLGLATVYGIVKQHGGNIWVYSEPGQGSTFKVYLPVCDDPSAPRPQRAEPARESLATAGGEIVLLVEDSADVREMTRIMLESSGYRVVTAASGEHALTCVASLDRLPDLLLTDVVMPGLNGRELHERLCERQPDLKVVYMSGYTDDIIVQRGVLEKNTIFVQKPFSREILLATIRRVLTPSA